MKATRQLKDEHQGVLLMLRVLESINQRLSSGEKVGPEDLEKILEFLQVFVDKCHHAKEEGKLFPAMEEAGIPKKSGPIGIMLLDHDKGRGYIKGLAEGVAKYKDGDTKAAKKIVENAQKYIDLLRLHIDRENNILYEMADETLSPQKQEELFEEFEKIEVERIGLGKHEQFHKLLEDLKEKYLKLG